ncbi:MAG: metal-dependent transcriptional regulator [Candidatus Brocadiaceae bacterium]|nr:metal-dependent transcriptional regulator [Candidatus Brocadiaceae bacterium]
MVNAKKREDYIKEEHISEEVLELIWTAEEENSKLKKEFLFEKFGREKMENTLLELTESKLIKDKDSGIILTKMGQDKARQIIRRHRLAERLLHDVLDASDEVYERGACQFEHFINEDITTSICTLLGHPEVCPHGKLIPPGKCCSHAKQKLQPVLGPLSRLRAGVKAEVVYISSTIQTSIDFLSSVGVVPGLKFTIHHRKPSLVIQFDDTQLALDDEVAINIYVRVITG